ncbi:MAG TPA: class I SAM-dependent methyltransferase [Casimicrobiaceae bacterium]|nr:class I SAM-dependent methyltransferase [Casimicrobiaceae bacterium]
MAEFDVLQLQAARFNIMKTDEKTIRDFGEQWTKYSDAEGFFGSVALLADFIEPFQATAFRGARVADVGAGTGRFVVALLELGASQVIAVEPSAAAEVVREKTRRFGPDRVSVLNITGDKIPADASLDYAISVGVLHHIVDPRPVVAAVFEALKPGGQFVVWLYGKEGNGLYLSLVLPIRALSKHLPATGKAVITRLLDIPLALYVACCKQWPSAPLPLSRYMTEILGKLEPDKRRLVIYDQLNPHYAKYYTRSEAEQLLRSSPFEVAVHHRKGYSWVVIGTKPNA